MSPIFLSGLLAAGASALVGAGWQLASRHGVLATGLGPLELAWLRYGLPAFVLLPLLLRRRWRPRVRAGRAVLLAMTGGLPFGLLVLAGLRWAPAAYLGVFMAGTMPLFTAVACRLWLGEGVPPRRWAGLLVVAAGVAILAAASLRTPQAGAWRGDLLFMAAAALWAVHTVILRAGGLTPWQTAALVNGGSALVLLVALVWAPPLGLFAAHPSDLAFQAAVQGGVAGLLGLVTYAAAVQRLGPARAALSAAAVPLLTTAGAAAWLGETPDAATLLAAVLVAGGIVLAGYGRRVP